jgi:hypothetical protein
MTFPFLERLSIRNRLLLLTMLTSGIGMLLGCVGFLIYNLRAIRIEKIRELQPRAELGQRHLPIMAMTAHAMAGDAENFLAVGMDGYVSKPIQIGILRAEIDRLTHSPITDGVNI